MKVLIIFAHPAFHKSKVNKVLVDGLSDIDHVTFHDLYQEYPDNDIDIKREQTLLSQHDLIVFQFPLFWYSTPSLLKEWQDLVLEHGWAFGSKGNALKDKWFLCAITAGGPRNAYRIEDFHSHTLHQLLSPLKQTAKLCKMKPLPPFVVHGTHAIELTEVKKEKVNLLKLLYELTNDNFSFEEAEKYEYLNDYITKK
ncbi:NAD(P)H-dependent oxidoreductase [Labilibacter marinus]|uniref:NAD(P)H-dependent oxidoreductase n=1 Tax=Labilibacter marinus TaxID=1477105 RepID=UPI00094FA571|nr:NAD(P)H-dependent oxidoreductase [Labilibacter marinus]